MLRDSPPLTRYRLLEGYPDRLNYKNGRVVLSFCANRDNCWMFFAEKENDPASWIEIMRRPTMHEWARARFEGFDVSTGSPADKIMQRLVREGGAVVIGTQAPRRKLR